LILDTTVLIDAERGGSSLDRSSMMATTSLRFAEVHADLLAHVRAAGMPRGAHDLRLWAWGFSFR
jgi:hypothetical protein